MLYWGAEDPESIQVIAIMNLSHMDRESDSGSLQIW